MIDKYPLEMILPCWQRDIRTPIGLAIETGNHDTLVFPVRPRIMTILSRKLHSEFVIIGLVKNESQSNYLI